MGQITYRGNLSARAFPLVAEHFGRTVIVGGQDQNFNRQVQSEADIDKDRGIPQVYYCHNVMPTAEGFQSVAYNLQTTGTGALSNFKYIFNSRKSDGTFTPFAHGSDGKNYIISGFFANSWTQINTIPGDTGTAKVSTAVISGQTYFCFEGLGIYYLNVNVLTKITLTGITEANVKGITSSSGYLIAWTDTYVGWSSAVAHINVADPFDFTPSLVTGAGGGNIEMARGPITVCVNHYLGFIIYTSHNAIGAVYSGNSRFPFNFKEIIGAGGLTDPKLISTDSDAGNHYAYTYSGLQLVSMTGVVNVMSEVTDFLSGRYFEDFDDTTKTFTRTALAAPMDKAVNMISDRYLILSYGISVVGTPVFTHAIVYDTFQKRFGKVKTTHVATYEFGILSFSAPDRRDAARTSIGFMASNGAIQTMDFTLGNITSNGTIILGKYQYIRARTMTLDGIELENVLPTSSFTVNNLLSVDGKNTELRTVNAITPVVGNLRSYSCRQTGINHSLVIQGNFYLSSLVLQFHINGRR